MEIYLQSERNGQAMEDCYNHVELCGGVLTAPEPSHTNHGESFYRFLLSVPRLWTRPSAQKLSPVVSSDACRASRPQQMTGR
mgnify:CR=1 FL=1